MLDNGCGTLGVEFPEVSIVRRLDRSGDGEYRMNGARCRLVDVLEVLSDTGLGKEAHSVVSQGRVESIVTSKPRDRRMLIEEAAGLGKHRKRRRRAQLKLEKTQENLDRALDVEREARSRLRPLKRQAEAAELHERLARQQHEARWSLARDDVRAATRRAGRRRGRGHRRPRGADRGRGRAGRRGQAPRGGRAGPGRALRAARGAVGPRAPRRGRRPSASSCASTAPASTAAPSTSAPRRREPTSTRSSARRPMIRRSAPAGQEGEAIAALEAELRALDADRAAALEAELAELAAGREAAPAPRRPAWPPWPRSAAPPSSAAEEACAAARTARREAEATAEATRREAARVGADLAAVNQFLRGHAGAPGGATALVRRS